MLTVDGISAERGGQTLLDEISVAVAPGDFMAVIGPNGAGKSSLLHAIVGDLAPNHGMVMLDGRAIDDLDLRARARQVALLPQASALTFPFAVHEVVALGRSPHASGRQIDAGIVEAACDLTDIRHLRERAYTRLSGGERQRVQLARVLAQIWRAESTGSRLLLLDEPVAALDLGHQQQIMDAVAALARAGVAVVMVLHDVSLAARYADRLLALRAGSVVAQGAPAEVVTPDIIHRLFDIRARILAHPDTGTPVVLHG